MIQVMKMKKVVTALSLEANPSSSKIARATSFLFPRERKVRMENHKLKAKEMTKREVVTAI